MSLPWLQVALTTGTDGRLQTSVSRSSEGHATGQQTTEATRDQVLQFAQSIKHSAATGAGLSSEQDGWARWFFQQLFGGEVGIVLTKLMGKQGGELLLRLMVSDPSLKAVPWEALRGPTDADSALATNQRVRVVRGVHSTNSGEALDREVKGAIRVLAVAPTEMAYAVTGLAEELAEPIANGQIAWLEPVVGAGAAWPNLLQRLQRGPWPHVLHIVAHGRLAGDKPQLLLEDAGGTWTDTESLAAALDGRVGDELRLVYLESCQGGDAGGYASSAERLAGTAAAAVVAHLWTAKADKARLAALQFYGALTDAAHGDVAQSVALARLGLTATAEFLCPVLYLRGDDPTLFNFRKRKLRARSAGGASGPLTASQQRALEDLQRTLEEPCTVFVGERVGPGGRPWGGDDLRTKLMGELELDEAGRFEPLPQMLQRYALISRKDKLRDLVQDVLDPIVDGERARSAMLDKLAAMMGPGLVVTQQWLPVVEQALADAQPDQHVVVLQPQDPGLEDKLQVFRRPPGGTTFTEDPDGLGGIDFSRDRVVLRLFGGYQAGNRRLRGTPVFTDDDRLRNLVEVGNLPRSVLAFLRQKPMIVLGVSPVQWSDRQLLQGLVGDQPMRRGSLAFMPGDVTDTGRAYWDSEHGPARASGRVTVHAQSDLRALLTGDGAS